MKTSRTLLTCFLAMLVFLTSTGMTLNLHFCANNIQSVSLEQAHQGCTMASKAATPKECESKSKSASVKKSETCCKNQQIKAKQPVKSIEKQDQACSAKAFAFIQTYFSNLFSFEKDADDEDQSDQSLFPLLKEGLYILLNQFRK